LVFFAVTAFLAAAFFGLSSFFCFAGIGFAVAVAFAVTGLDDFTLVAFSVTGFVGLLALAEADLPLGVTVVAVVSFFGAFLPLNAAAQPSAYFALGPTLNTVMFLFGHV